MPNGGHGRSSAAPATTVLSPAFKWIFITVVGLTLLNTAILFYLALQPGELNHQQSTMSSISANIVTGGVGAIFGLLGGKAL